eukprot:403343964
MRAKLKTAQQYDSQHNSRHRSLKNTLGSPTENQSPFSFNLGSPNQQNTILPLNSRLNLSSQIAQGYLQQLSQPFQQNKNQSGFSQIIKENTTSGNISSPGYPFSKGSQQKFDFQTLQAKWFMGQNNNRIIDVLNPQIDLFDGLLQDQTLIERNKTIQLNNEENIESKGLELLGSEVSTTFSEISNQDNPGIKLLKKLKQAQTNKNGKEIIPSYLKEDFPDPELLPCKELIASMPSHVDRPPAEKFDSIILNLYKNRFRQRKKRENILDLTQQIELQDKQYIEMFGTIDLQIQRDQSKLKKDLSKKQDQQISLKDNMSRFIRNKINNSSLNQSLNKDPAIQEGRKFMISLERTDMKVKKTFEGSANGLQNERAPMLFTKFNKINHQETLLPIPLGFFNTKNSIVTTAINPKQKSNAINRLQSAPQQSLNNTRVSTHHAKKHNFIGSAAQSNQISPTQKMKTINFDNHEVLEESTINQSIRKSLQQNRKPLQTADKNEEFFNKKKIPGILDYLESKIYERSNEKHQQTLFDGTHLNNPKTGFTSLNNTIDQDIYSNPLNQALDFNGQSQVLSMMPQDMARAQNYYFMDFDMNDQAISKKQPLVDTRKRKLLSNLLKNEQLVMKSVHNSLIERIIYNSGQKRQQY